MNHSHTQNQDIHMANYLIPPTKTEGFYDTHGPLHLADPTHGPTIYGFITELCLRINTALQMAVNGPYDGMIASVTEQFATIMRGQLGMTDHLSQVIQVDLSQCVHFDPYEVSTPSQLNVCPRETALEERDELLDAICNWAMDYLNGTLLPDMDEDYTLCATHLSAYITFALDALSRYWFNQVAPFIAYPFYCDAFFQQLRKSEEDCSMADLIIQHWCDQSLDDTTDQLELDGDDGLELLALNPIPTCLLYHGYHMALDSTCYLVTDKDGPHPVSFGSSEFLNAFFSITNQEEDVSLEALSFDLTDMDAYV